MIVPKESLKKSPSGARAVATRRVARDHGLRLESCRALIRLRALGVARENRLADAKRDIAAIWARCELSPAALGRVLRALDSIHLATFVLARRELEGLKRLTVDEHLQASVTEPPDAGT